MLDYLKARLTEATTHLGAVLAAVSAGAVAANALAAPWSYIAFASAALLAIAPERK